MLFEKLCGKILSTINEQKEGTIAMVPGSFKPPHKGHYSMIEYFSTIANKVYVVISDPQSEKSIRRTLGGKKISGQQAREILEIYGKNLNNIEYVVSPQPVKWVYDFVKDDTVSGQEIFLGVSGKGDDANRYLGAQKYAPEGVTVTSKIFKDSNLDISASDFRNIIDNPTIETIEPYLPYHLSDMEKEEVLNILNQLGESSSDSSVAL